MVDRVRRGDAVLPAGRLLLPQDVGLLSSIGRSTAAVHRRPRVAMLATGDDSDIAAL